MNERINELERQAEKFVMSIPASLDINEYTSVFNEKFAELIVTECANVADKYVVDGDWHIAEIIKRHFGVES